MPDRRCAACASELPKYKCPRCSRMTCSVGCVKDHKVMFRCSGKRRVVQVVSKSEYDERTVLEDYALLERTARARNQARWHFRMQHTNSRRRSVVLKRACYKRGIQLFFAPPIFQKNETNKSFYNQKADTILWHVEFIFQCESSSKDYCSTFPEGIRLFTALKNALRSMNDCASPLEQTELAPFRATPLEELCCFFEVLRNKWTMDKRFYKLDINRTITENLQSRVVIEYPTIVVCLPSNAHLFPQLTDEVKLCSLKTKNWERVAVERSVEEITSFMEKETGDALYSHACRLNRRMERTEVSSPEEGELIEEKCPPRLVQLKPSDWRPKLSSSKPRMSVQERRAMKREMIMRMADELAKRHREEVSEPNVEAGRQHAIGEIETPPSHVWKTSADIDYFGLLDDAHICTTSEAMNIQYDSSYGA
uniref:HIT-type domain-containing protein n=1 Tax=Trichuris muris TaxID=70415 RepID=A0A5S6R2T5_TRIMR